MSFGGKCEAKHGAIWLPVRLRARRAQRVGNPAQTQPRVAAEHVGVVRPTERGQEPATCYWSLPLRSAKQMLNFKDSTKQRMHSALHIIFYGDYMLE